MNNLQLKDIRNKMQTSLSQLKMYYEAGLIERKCDSKGKIFIDEIDVITVFQIKSLKYMGFSLKYIKLILNNISSKEVFKLIYDFFKKENNFNQTFFQIQDDFKRSGEVSSILDKNTFGFFRNNSFCKYYSFEMYENRKIWYEDSEKKDYLKKTRKEMFLMFKNYSPKTFEDSGINKKFESINNFFIENVLGYSILHFVTYFAWICGEQRYVKEFRSLAGINYSKELFDKSFDWILKSSVC